MERLTGDYVRYVVNEKTEPFRETERVRGKKKKETGEGEATEEGGVDGGDWLKEERGPRVRVCRAEVTLKGCQTAREWVSRANDVSTSTLKTP